MEQELADRFQAALANEPPLGFDPDDVVDRAIRMGHRRAAVLGASTAAAAVVIGAVTVLQVIRVGDAPVGGAGSAPTSKPTVTKPLPTCPTKPTGTKSSEPEPTKPTDPKPKPTETKPTGTKPSEPEPTKPTETKPPCDPEPKDGAATPFTGADDIIKKLQDIVPPILVHRAPGVRFGQVLHWQAYDGRRCLTSAFQLNGDGYSAISITICHEQKTGLRTSPDAVAGPSDWGAPVSDTPRPDGSHLRVYKFDAGSDAGGLAVLHARPDGVVVQVDTGYKSAHGQRGPVLPQEQLTAIATDNRLTF